MKNFLVIFFIFCPYFLFAQPGVNYHHSGLPFLGINYEINERVRPELRIGTNTLLDDLSFEGVVTYDVLDQEDYEFYAGLGARTSDYSGIVIPLGLNFYPFTTKNFGFHMELAPIIGDAGDLLRGAWGIRYRFRTD